MEKTTMEHTCIEPRPRDIRRHAMQFTSIAAVLFLILNCTIASLSQAISGDLVGAVADPSGAVVPSAQVVAVNVATDVKTTTLTNQNGEFHIANLPVGKYNITASAPGFNAVTVN